MTLEFLHKKKNKISHFSLEMDKFLVSNWNSKQLVNEFNSTFNMTFSQEKIQSHGRYLRKLGILMQMHKKGRKTKALKHQHQNNDKKTKELIDSIARVGAVLRFGDSSQSSIDRYLEQVIKNAVKADCARCFGGP